MKDALAIPTARRDHWLLDSDAHRIGAVSALFILYLGMWVIFGAGQFDWPSFLSAVATLTIVAWAARNSGSLFRTYFLLLGASLAFDTLLSTLS